MNLWLSRPSIFTSITTHASLLLAIDVEFFRSQHLILDLSQRLWDLTVLNLICLYNSKISPQTTYSGNYKQNSSIKLVNILNAFNHTLGSSFSYNWSNNVYYSERATKVYSRATSVCTHNDFRLHCWRHKMVYRPLFRVAVRVISKLLRRKEHNEAHSIVLYKAIEQFRIDKIKCYTDNVIVFYRDLYAGDRPVERNQRWLGFF